MKKLPWKSLMVFLASPQGRRMITQARSWLEKPENRARLVEARRRYDTPENRARLAEQVARARRRPRH